MFHGQATRKAALKPYRPENLPVFDILGMMRLTDDAILEVIRELGTVEGRVRGNRVRDLLLQRFGHRASTDRVYRLLRQHEREQLTAAEREAARTAEEEASRLRAELAEARAALQAALDRLASPEQQLAEEAARLRVELEETRQALKAAIERAELAEYREESHLNMWANELHELRRKVAYYESPERLRERARAEADLLETAKALVRAQQDVTRLKRLLEAHGIAY